MTRKPTTLARALFRQLQTPLALLILHGILLQVAGHTHAIASVFAAGPHVPKGTLLLAVSFLGIRFVVVALIPGFIVARTTYAVLSWKRSQQAT
jgi:hypothetical protein